MSVRAEPEATTTGPAGSRSWVWLIAIWAIVTAYNLFKPYHIDDDAHLEIAKWIMGHPLHPMSGILNWSGVDEPIYRTNQPHLYFYLMALWGRFFGFSEPAQHSLQSLSSLACILLFHRLARFLASHLAVWATAIVFLGPAFIVEQNMMVDTPLLATWLAFFTVLVCGVRSEHQTRRYVLASLACAAAVLIKYSSLVLLPVFVLSLLLERRRGQAWTLLIPLVALAAWSGFNYFDYGGFHIAGRPGRGGAGPKLLLQYAAAWLVTLGALTPLGLIAAVQNRAIVRYGRWIFAAAGLAFAALVLAVASGAIEDRIADKVLSAGFFGSAAFVAVLLAAEAAGVGRLKIWRRDDALDAAPKIYLFLWIAGTSAFYVLFSPFIASRHVLLIIPPVTLLLVGRWGDRLAPSARVFGLVATAVVSMGLGLSDWRFADFYRVEARALQRSLSPTSRIWISGHWGFQWYAKQNGLHEVDIRSSPLAPGDSLVVATDGAHEELVAPPPLTRFRTDSQTQPLLSLFCTARKARLYLTPASQVGPWSLSRTCIQHVELFRVGGGPSGTVNR